MTIFISVNVKGVKDYVNTRGEDKDLEVTCLTAIHSDSSDEDWVNKIIFLNVDN
jgi:hypothetical protein